MDDGAPRGIAEALQGILGTLSPEKWARLNQVSKETGIYTSFVPEEYGGGGMGALGHVVLDEEVHKSIVQLPTSPVPMMMIGNCTSEQEQEYLLPSIRGEMHYAFGQTEPEAGSDPGGMMQTRAVLDGDDWVLNGTKTFISGAASADYILVQAVTDPELRQRGGITMFIVDNPSPGLSLRPHPHLDQPPQESAAHGQPGQRSGAPDQGARRGGPRVHPRPEMAGPSRSPAARLHGDRHSQPRAGNGHRVGQAASDLRKAHRRPARPSSGC